jgi:hypothetical protein
VRYLVNTHFIAGLALNANAGAADAIGFTLDYSFPKAPFIVFPCAR